MESMSTTPKTIRNLFHDEMSLINDAIRRDFFANAMPFGDRFIWGATAGIIRTLYERLYA